MLNRVKQVLSAVTAKITEVDKNFVDCHLNKQERKLFWRMNLPDQRHALNVAYTAIQMASNQPFVNSQILIKSALLHDVGKVKGDVSTIDKILTVIAHKFAGKWVKRWGRLGKGNKLTNLRHAVYIYFQHPMRSAEFLIDIGEDPLIVDIVSRHHKAPAENDPPELNILRKADSLN